MLILTSILLITFGVFSSATDYDLCKTRRVDHCYGPDEIGHVRFPDSVEALDKICPILIPRFKCMLDFKNKCSEKDWPPLFILLDQVNGLVVKACDKDSKFYNELALHLPCIQENLMSYRNTCRPIIKEALEEMISDLNIDSEVDNIFFDKDDRAKNICISEALVYSCFVTITSGRCGERAGEMVEAALDQIGFWQTNCPEKLHEEVKAAAAIAQPFLEQRIATKGILSKIK